MEKNEPLIPKHGGYRNLKSFQIAQLVYDVTVRFCNRYIERCSRTHDQRVQAARSGVQNIAEGSQMSDTDSKVNRSTSPTECLYAGAAANAALVLIAVAVSLLNRQLAAQANAFEKEGGFTERLYRRRKSRRNT